MFLQRLSSNVAWGNGSGLGLGDWEPRNKVRGWKPQGELWAQYKKDIFNLENCPLETAAASSFGSAFPGLGGGLAELRRGKAEVLAREDVCGSLKSGIAYPSSLSSATPEAFCLFGEMMRWSFPGRLAFPLGVFLCLSASGLLSQGKQESACA